MSSSMPSFSMIRLSAGNRIGINNQSWSNGTRTLQVNPQVVGVEDLKLADYSK